MADRDAFTAALREARLSEAARLDAVLNVQDARALRLEALRATVAPLLSSHAVARELFELRVQAGETPKLWVDLVTAVVMEPDPRQYRLLQDRPQGRETLFETPDLKTMADHLTRFLAHRLVDHDRLMTSIAAPDKDSLRRYAMGDMVYVWFTGLLFGFMGLVALAMWLGKLNF